MVSEAMINLFKWSPYIIAGVCLFVGLTMFTNWLSK
jgi:hypothetical protein